MILRAVLVALLCGIVGFGAFVFEATSATARAFAIGGDAELAQSPNVRAALLLQAESTLQQSWAQPLAWHAGAAEVLSGLYYVRARSEGDELAFDRSAAAAAEAVRLAPVQPHAWTRLAALAASNHLNPVCTLAQCLDRSFAVAPMTDVETACVRLQLANSLTPLGADDARIKAYLALPGSRRRAAQCLTFLGPDALYQALMRARTSN